MVSIATSYAFYINFHKVYYLKHYGKCTVGVTLKQKVGSRGTLSILYKFKIGNKVYKGMRSKIGQVKVPNGKYVVVYYRYKNGLFSGILESTIVYKKPIEGYKLGDDLTDIISKDEIEFSIWR